MRRFWLSLLFAACTGTPQLVPAQTVVKVGYPDKQAQRVVGAAWRNNKIETAWCAVKTDTVVRTADKWTYMGIYVDSVKPAYTVYASVDEVKAVCQPAALPMIHTHPGGKDCNFSGPDVEAANAANRDWGRPWEAIVCGDSSWVFYFTGPARKVAPARKPAPFIRKAAVVGSAAAFGVVGGLIDRDHGDYRDDFVPRVDKLAHNFGSVICAKAIGDRYGGVVGTLACVAMGAGIEFGQSRHGGYASWRFDFVYDIGGSLIGGLWSRSK